MPTQSRPNWFPTLAQALESEGLQDEWPINHPIKYGEYARIITPAGRLISIYRETNGMYERPVHYWVNPQSPRDRINALQEYCKAEGIGIHAAFSDCDIPHLVIYDKQTNKTLAKMEGL